MRGVLLAFFTFVLVSVQANTYYFSTGSGDDSRTATQAQNQSTPWKTLSKLNSVFNTLQPGDFVLLKRGETFLGPIIIFKSNYTKPITIGAYGSGAKPIITGLQSVTNWVSIGGGIYESLLNQGSLNLVTFQDILQPLGRWPKLSDPHAGYLPLQSHVGSSSITSNAIGSAKDFTGGEVVIRKVGWILDRGIITSQTSTQVAYTPLPSPTHPQSAYEPIDGFGFFFQNHINALTTLGDWMFDRTTKKLKMYFGANNPSSYTVQVPTVQKLVDIKSSTYITIDNITLRGADSNAINIDDVFNLQVTNCDLTLCGTDAITTAKKGVSSDITVKNCNFTNNINNALSAYATERWTIQNNIFKNTGAIRGMGLSGDGQYIAIASPGTKSLIEYNEVINTGYNAIEFRGDSTVVKNNFVNNFCIVKSDGGGIYNSGESDKKGRRIIGNIVLNGQGDLNGRKESEANNPFAGNVHGIYMDGGATDIQISDNTAAFCSSSGLELSSPRNTEVRNNTFFNNTFRQIYYWESFGPISNLTLKNNILLAVNRNELIAYIDGISNTVPNWGVLDSNYYCRPLFEPDNINSFGYSHGLDDYPDGGIIQTFDYKYLSLDVWKAYSKQDAHTKKSPIPVSSPKNIRFEYNATTSNKTISLDTTYVDVRGNTVNNSITLAPFTSVILLKASLPQTITFGPLADKNKGDAPFQISATSSVGLPVSFRVISGPATIINNTVTLKDSTGLVTIEAYQDGNDYYYSAPPVRQSFTVGIPGCVAPTFVNNGLIVLDATCSNNDGNLNILPLTGVAPFMYSKDGGATYVSGPNAGYGFQGLSAGTYKLRLKDSKGCESAIIERAVKMICASTCASTFTSASADATCANNDGAITIQPTGGVAPFMYSINGGSTYVSGPNAGYTFNNLAANTYQLRIKDATGCESQVVGKTVNFNCTSTCTPPTFVNNGLIVLDASCSNNDGSLSIIPTSGTAPFMYSKDGGKTYVPGPDAGYGFGGLSAGTYQLRLKDVRGCESAIVDRSVKILYGTPCSGSMLGSPGPEPSLFSQGDAVSVYPNPTRGKFKLLLRNFVSTKAEVLIINGEGKLLEKRGLSIAGNTFVDFDLSTYAPGLYYIKVIGSRETKVTKVIRQ
jgi:parallel beta-helix repeat protein